MPDLTLESTPGGDVVVSDPAPATDEIERPELASPLLENAEPVKNRQGEPLTDEQIADRYQDPPVPRDPNTPISRLDPNDRLRAEGPEVADPAKVAAGIIFEEAKANMPEPKVEDTKTPEQQTAEDLARFDTIAATGPGSGVAGAPAGEPEPAPVQTIPTTEPTPAP